MKLFFSLFNQPFNLYLDTSHTHYKLSYKFSTTLKALHIYLIRYHIMKPSLTPSIRIVKLSQCTVTL